MNHLMPEIVHSLCDVFSAKHAAARPGNFHENLSHYYRELGLRFGFNITIGRNVVRHSINYGKIDCIWVQENPVVGIEVEFGGKEDVLASIWKLSELEPEVAVLVTSSYSRGGYSVDEIRELIEGSKFLRNTTQKFILIDIETGKALQTERVYERHKMIYGHRMKEQD